MHALAASLLGYVGIMGRWKWKQLGGRSVIDGRGLMQLFGQSVAQRPNTARADTAPCNTGA